MTMTVTVRHAPNPDIVGGYWQHPVDSRKARQVPVDDIEDASYVCRRYIDRNELGGGNWTGGDVFNNGEYIGRISYNGRFWQSTHEYGKQRKAKESRMNTPREQCDCVSCR